ncbi:PAS domain-containing protein [Bacillus pinisoli]|uniref:SpoIIE family protein phosphatase n=1 Tax=Bacillus pinisoli TaxID=2901866 RepID=UPI001FF66AAC|nr:PAS domain-containing protein [Bacillus pinisoli]
MEFKVLELVNELIEYSPDSIMILDSQGFYVYANDTSVKMFGIQKEDLIGHHFYNKNKLTSDSLEYCLEIFPEVMRGTVKVIKIRAFNDREEEIILSVNCKLIQQDNTDYLYLILRDLTKEYIWEHEKGELLEYNELLVQAMNQSGVGILITDPKLEDNPIVYVNEGFTKMTGYQKKEVLGRNCRLLQGPRTNCETVNKIRESINGQTRVHEELLNYRKDRTTFWNELTISPVTSQNGKTEYFIGIQRDITTRKILEMELENDLKVARNLQQLLLSKPIIETDITITGFYKPSHELGGDLYKWFQIYEGLYGVFIIDVMGHGISSSLLTMSLHTEIVSLLQRDIYTPSEVMTQLNKLIFNMFADDLDLEVTKYYFTAVYLLIDTREKKIEYVNAGHPDFIIKNNEDFLFLPSTTIPVGMLEEVSFETSIIPYEVNSEIVLYTDGLLEHMQMTKEDLAEVLLVKKVDMLLDQYQYMPKDDICVIHIDLL